MVSNAEPQPDDKPKPIGRLASLSDVCRVAAAAELWAMGKLNDHQLRAAVEEYQRNTQAMDKPPTPPGDEPV